MRNVSLNEQFTYHPPKTEARKAKHDCWNNKVKELISWLSINVEHDAPFDQAVWQAQHLRMLGNMCITYDELVEDKCEQ